MSEANAVLYNGSIVSRKKVPVFTMDEFIGTLSFFLSEGFFLSAYFGDKESGYLYAFCSDSGEGHIHVLSGRVEKGEFPSLVEKFPSVHLFEREIYEETGFIPKGHPRLKPVRFPQKGKFEIGEIPFFKVAGEEIHQVAVGPVHAGVIEPGHFRFQCHGEKVYHLEISLGYQHRGIEEQLAGGPFQSTPYLMETVSGDTTIGHMIAYCQVIESLTDTRISIAADIIRAVSLELERCANHIGDVGALAGDAGFLPTQSYCGRIRGDFLNMTALLCGNRFGRGLVVPGGVGSIPVPSTIDELYKRIESGLKEFLEAAGLMFANPGIVSRLESIGEVPYQDARALGLAGFAARASGVPRDIRHNFAYGYYRFSTIPMVTYDTGTVFARAYLRLLEVQESVQYLMEQLPVLKRIVEKDKTETLPLFKKPLKGNMLGVSLVEGWRGEICHVAMTDKMGKFEKYKIYDPSFRNWEGLARALRNEQISEFPLCNKSFNLSYCGHDL